METEIIIDFSLGNGDGGIPVLYFIENTRKKAKTFKYTK